MRHSQEMAFLSLNIIDILQGFQNGKPVIDLFHGAGIYLRGMVALRSVFETDGYGQDA